MTDCKTLVGPLTATARELHKVEFSHGSYSTDQEMSCFIESECPLPSSQATTTGPCCELDEFSFIIIHYFCKINFHIIIPSARFFFWFTLIAFGAEYNL